MSHRTSLHLFEGFGVELEYMIVDKLSLNVRPNSDLVLRDPSGAVVSDLDDGDISWSNELVAHVIELKTNGPADSLSGLSGEFHRSLGNVIRALEPHGLTLLPTAAHPWMDPAVDTVLWKHDYSVVYETFDRIFSCKGHGWSNLQSVHINLPFSGSREFGRLHAAIRLVLPLIPAMAASSPLIGLETHGCLDNRMRFYRSNSVKVPSVVGRVIPEPLFTIADYREKLLAPLYRDISPYDPDGVLQHEWLNARGAIARFTRDAIEIRVTDIQECPTADLALVSFIVGIVRALVEEDLSTFKAQKAASVDELEPVLLSAIWKAEGGVVESDDYLRRLGLKLKAPVSLSQVLRALMCDERVAGRMETSLLEPLRAILEAGSLSTRILQLVGNGGREAVESAYRRLSGCLARNELFLP